MSKKEEADLINESMEDSIPTMPDAPLNIVTLMRGLMQETEGKTVWHTDAEIRELNGEDEEYLASLEKKKGLTYSEYMTALLSRAVTKIGTYEIAGERGNKIIDKLILGDRDLLYLGIMKATYGDTRQVRVICPHCQVSNDVTLDLDEDFPVTKPDFDVKKGIVINTSKGDIRLRLPNGEDTLEVQKSTKSDAEINTMMLARCTMWKDGEEPDDPVRWARTLNIADRRKLVDALTDIEIGPKMGEVDTQCASCEQDMPVLLDWVSLLLG